MQPIDRSPHPIVLALDTAHHFCQAAVINADGALFQIAEPRSRGHAERLISLIDEVLQSAQLKIKDVDRIVVTTGPGSFTGLRVGLAAARGIGVALKTPVLGVSTLEAMSLSAPPQTPHKILLDARRDQHFFQAFTAPGVPDNQPKLLENDMIQDYISSDDMVMGTGADFAAQHTKCTTHKSVSDWIDIARLARYGALLMAADYPPEPLYVRGADAKPQAGKSIPRQTVVEGEKSP